MECPACNGAGCGGCQAGIVTIMACPLEIIGLDVWDLIDYAALYEKGLPPVAGGALDQAIYFTRAAKWIFEEKNYWKRKLKIIDG